MKTKQEIKNLVRRKNKIAQVPVDLGEILERNNILLQYDNLPLNFDGISIQTNESLTGYAFFVLLNENHPPLRQRFTLAHEIGHIHLKHHSAEIKSCTLTNKSALEVRQLEREAHIYAAELLMPESIIRYFYADKKKTVEEMAEIFKVSQSAMSIRLEELGLKKPLDVRFYFDDPFGSIPLI